MGLFGGFFDDVLGFDDSGGIGGSIGAGKITGIQEDVFKDISG